MSHTFKPGDFVIRTGDAFKTVQPGQTYEVRGLLGDDSLQLIGHTGSYDASQFKAAAVSTPDTPKLQWTAIVGEKSRTYHFPDGSKFTVENVVRLCVRPTNHRLVCADGSKFVIPGKFIAIAINAETWSA